MKIRDPGKTMVLIALVILATGSGAAYCFSDSDFQSSDDKGSIEISSNLVTIDNINIEPVTSSPSGVVSIDSITASDYDKGEIRIAASHELVNAIPDTPVANEASKEAEMPQVAGGAESDLRPGLPGPAGSTAVLGSPSYMPPFVKLGTAARPINIHCINTLHHNIDSRMPIMQLDGIGTSIIACGPPMGVN